MSGPSANCSGTTWLPRPGSSPSDEDHDQREQPNRVDPLDRHADLRGFDPCFACAKEFSARPPVRVALPEIVYLITNLSSAQASPERLLTIVRGHWSLENGSHYVRDVTFGEDRSRLRSGNAPQVLARCVISPLP